MGEEDRAALGAAHFPLLGEFMEGDVRGPDDLEPSEHMEINRFGVETADAAIGVEAEAVAHGAPPPSPTV